MTTDTLDTPQRFGSGRAVQRIEDEGLLKGLGQYTDDVAPAGELRLAFVRSPYPHAKIVSIDTATARGMPGVLQVVTGAELVAAGVKPIPTNPAFKRGDGTPAATAPRRPLAHERVRYVGEPVVAVVAETLQQARDAAEAVWVEYEELSNVVTLDDAIAPDAPLVIQCEVRGEKLPPTNATPRVAKRIGLELNPVDLSNADDRDWLRALMWPDQISRLERLDKAVSLFHENKPEIRSGDALALLSGALRDMPEDQTVCIYHTIAVYQFSRQMKETLHDILTVAGLRRPVWRLSFEAESWDGRCPITLIRYHDGTRDERELGHAHPHGTWLEWTA